MKSTDNLKGNNFPDKSKSRNIVMLVGGTDPTGGAGLAADIGICRLIQVYPMPVVSCITSQDSKGFRKMQQVDIDIFRDQLESILCDVVPDSVKIGMLPSARHMKVLAEILCLYEHGPVIFDPIMAPSEGKDNFYADWWEDRDALKLFLTQVTLITPNASELHKLTAPLRENPELKTHVEIAPEIKDKISEDDAFMMSMVSDMHLLRIFYGIERILLTGGHNKGSYLHNDFILEPRPDLECPPELMDDLDEEVTPMAYALGRITGEDIDTPNTHGTGCIYSSAIAGLLAKKVPTHIAIRLAKEIVGFLLKGGKDWRLYEEGHGPAYSVISLPEAEFPAFPINRDLSDFLN